MTDLPSLKLTVCPGRPIFKGYVGFSEGICTVGIWMSRQVQWRRVTERHIQHIIRRDPWSIYMSAGSCIELQ